MKTKPMLFIGSSKESSNIAKKIKENLQPYCQCVIWNENFFELNQSTYYNLVKKSIAFDYAVFIGGADDNVTRIKTKESKKAPRDNIYLEFGLYAGILSPSHTYFFINKKSTIASDLSGITLIPYYTENDINEGCEIIIKKIKKENKINRIQLLPSTSLALGYFENFLKIAGRELMGLDTIEVDGIKYNVENYEKKLEIVIPNIVGEDWKTWAEMFCKKHHLKKVFLNGAPRNIGVLVDYELIKSQKKLLLFDIPQTIRSSFITIDLVIGKDCIGEEEIILMAKQKEVNNFIKALQNLIKSDSYTKEYIKIKKYSK